MGWVIGAGLALFLLMLVACANFILIAARLAMDPNDAKFLLLALSALGSGQALTFIAVAQTGVFSAPLFEMLWFASICIAISSLVAVAFFGGASQDMH